MICDPTKNPPIPAGLATWAAGGQALTPAMQQWAAGIANDLSIPIGSVYRKWFGQVPVVGIVLCHSYTVINGENIPGAYHGVTLFYPTDLSLMPPETSLAAPPATTMLEFAFFGIVVFSTVFGIANTFLAKRSSRAQ